MLDISADGPVRVVMLNRPASRNAIDGATADALARAFREFDGDDAVAVAVLTGAGGTFCSGADLKALETVRVEPPPADGPLGVTRLQLSKPVIAAIEGYAVAGGFEVALWCDLRVAAEDAVFGVFNRRWGVPLIDGGCLRLPRLVGEGRALDLILTGRPVDATEAERIGLVNRVVPPGQALAAAIALAHQLAAFPQAALRADRLSVYDPAGEYARGRAVISSSEAAAGAARFKAGEGRGGQGV